MNTYLVTGSSGDIGKSIVETLLKDQNNRVVGIDINEAEVKKNNYVHIKLDLSDLLEVEKLDIEKYKITHIIHTAGIYNSKNLIDYDIDLIERTINVNVLSLVILVKKLLESSQNISNMVILSSTAGMIGSKDPIYSLSKASLHGLMKSWIKTINCRINIVSPGIIDTKMSRTNQSDERRRHHIENTYAKRIGEIGDVVELVMYFLGEKSSYVWGQNVYINGGMT